MATSHLPRRSDVAVHVAISHWPKGNLVTKFVSFQKPASAPISYKYPAPPIHFLHPKTVSDHLREREVSLERETECESLDRRVSSGDPGQNIVLLMVHSELHDYLDDLISLNRKRLVCTDPGVRSGDGPDSPVVELAAPPLLVKGKWVAPMDERCGTLRPG
ncbi:hypothetical protein Bca101_018064 [Brassica carinata]